jgi:predicted cupin superfamily sugar epimerase
LDKDFYIKTLNLKPLLTHDYLVEFFRADEEIRIDKKTKQLVSFVYYLIPKGSVFPFHKMESYSSWHYCAGSPLSLYNVQNGEMNKVVIGPDMSKGHQFCHITPKNTWFCAESTGDFTLVTHCIVPAYYDNQETWGFEEVIEKDITRSPELANRFLCHAGKSDKYLLKEEEYRNLGK